jgi:hypothetical protein
MTVDNNVLIAAFGRNKDVANYTPPPYEKLAHDARVERNRRLMYEVDPIVTNPLRWADMTPDVQSAWTQYRTDLLNITNQNNFPYGIDWPTKPQ